MKPERTLVRRAACRLRKGSAHTLELARSVLCLRGNEGASAAAVFALLGSDRRFQVDPEGFWSLAEDSATLGEGLLRPEYAVVDVETTGSTPHNGHRVTEIAIVVVRGGVIEEHFRTLVNPGRRIPDRIAALTGITDRLVAGAPFFEDIAPELVRWLEGRVFVAHNASFDWRFLEAQLGDALGQVPDVSRLCTVRLARRFLPHLRRRSLDEVAGYFGIPIHGRHRAYGDALATARVLLRLLDEAERAGYNDVEALMGRGRSPAARQREGR